MAGMDGAFTRFKARWAGWTRPERVQFLIAVLLQLALLGALVGALAEQRWLVAFTALVVLILTFLPAALERELGVQLPVELTLITSLFLYASFGLGELQDFYVRFWWWDILLHGLSAVVLGLTGFLLVYTFHFTRRVVLPPVYFGLTAFGFAVTLGTLWEIFEFLMDWGFGFNMQKSGLRDTMTDLMVNATGAALAGWSGHRYVRDGDSLLADRLLRRLAAKNPRLFGDNPD
ncbi:MAG: hypothetical protein ACLFRB_03435 [Thiohalorhabdus sp.]|uniref:hypothetical protein n=1 Tax=Thiohalorhabdus sp. TaxID=3094134 RepID=UPI00398076DC